MCQTINHNTAKVFFHRTLQLQNKKSTAHRTVWDHRNTARWDFIHRNTPPKKSATSQYHKSPCPPPEWIQCQLLESLYGGQFTLSTLLIKPNFCVQPPHQHSTTVSLETTPLLDFMIDREGEWDFYWCDVGWMREYFDHTYMEEHVKICHFRNHYEVQKYFVWVLVTSMVHRGGWWQSVPALSSLYTFNKIYWWIITTTLY